LKNINSDGVTPRAVTVDTGEVSNSFGLCVSRYYSEQQGLAFEEFIEVAPSENAIVDLAWCYNELVIPLVQSFNIKHVVYDRWESGYAVSDLRTNHDIDAQKYSLRFKDFDTFKNDLLGSRIWLPKPEKDPDELLQHDSLAWRANYPRANFQAQITTVNQFNRKITKPDYGNDDLFRTAVLAHYIIMNNKKIYSTNVASTIRKGPVAMVFLNNHGSRYR
jgi:hypothetical protein